ncbi:MAG: amidophosphoribosyltransferase [Eubacterium sp.]|nr:amidophosphoribosyltransferase [Eubacterium sp.]
MGGFFGVASKNSCTNDLFFGIDYHSHLGTRRGGMAVYGSDGFHRSIHNIENSPFRTKFDSDLDELEGKMGIGCISDSDPQPLLIRSHHGSYALTTVGKINNADVLFRRAYERGNTHFMEMSGSRVNDTELIAVLIDMAGNLVDGMRLVQESVEGSMSLLLMTPGGIYAMRDRWGRTPVIIGKKKDAYCATFETSAYINLGYDFCYELGPGEIVHFTAEGYEVMSPARKEMRICSFLWVYYGYPTSAYEGINVEEMRYKCGHMLARRDQSNADMVAGVPDSGIAHAIGYSNESGIPYARPFIKYTPTWPRSFMPTRQSQRELIAHMKLIPVRHLIENKSLLLIDDSIVRGTQLGQTVQYLYESGAKEVHIRPACPPLMYGCKYLNFSRSRSEYDYITRRVIRDREGEENMTPELIADYADPDSQNYKEMQEDICKRLDFTSLEFQRLDDLVEATGLEACKLCTYCWNGKE